MGTENRSGTQGMGWGWVMSGAAQGLMEQLCILDAQGTLPLLLGPRGPPLTPTSRAALKVPHPQRAPVCLNTAVLLSRYRAGGASERCT